MDSTGCTGNTYYLIISFDFQKNEVMNKNEVRFVNFIPEKYLTFLGNGARLRIILWICCSETK